MTDSINKFKNYYRDQVVGGLNMVSEEKLLLAANQIITVIKEPRGTIYIFGNGGSAATARHLEISLKERFGASKYDVRINCGLDFHISQSSVIKRSYDNIFTDRLLEEKADKRDLVVLVSGSGNSDNLLHAAAFCRDQYIPTISFAGFDGGRLSQPGVTDIAIIAPIHDQQICEDIIQSSIHLLVEVAYLSFQGQKSKFKNLKDNYTKKLISAFNGFADYLISNLTLDVVGAFLEGKGVYLLAPEGHGFSIVAEHVAHNFNWDAVYQIENPPQRHIHSTPTVCDFSGVGNDRLLPGVVSLQQLDKAKKDDVLLLFTYDPSNAAVVNVLNKASKVGMRIYTVAAKDRWSKEIAVDSIQAFGHMCGRIIRLRLKLALGQESATDFKQILITEDMANRRLLAKPGL